MSRHRRWLCAGLMLLAATGTWAADPLGLARSASPKMKLPPLGPLPEGKTQPPGEGVGEKGQGIHAGTAGLALPGVKAAGRGISIAILGDLAPTDAATRDKYLKMAVSELNLLRPELVLTVGNLLPGAA